jgi:hypothetical protein
VPVSATFVPTNPPRRGFVVYNATVVAAAANKNSGPVGAIIGIIVVACCVVYFGMRIARYRRK